MESLLAQHIASRHTPETVHICDNCDFNSHSTTELLHHEANFHGNRDSLTINTAEPDILENQCSMYDDTPEANNEMVEENDEMIVDNDEMMIPQVDGNDSLCTSDGFLTPNPDIASTNRPSYNNTPGHMQLLYTLNPENQSKRLLENSSRHGIQIRYNNPQKIQGQQHPTNVSLDCNSGVYISAVKPALEAISEGWQTNVKSIQIQCEGMSTRLDMSGRKVQTKLTLYLTEQTSVTRRCKVVLHFYHTSNTVQVQGSSLLSCGTNAPVWLVKHFIEPLATVHANQNKAAIDVINSSIRQSETRECNHCNIIINPSARFARDQELLCSKCGKVFHKKCTDRRSTTANWKKSPWYCGDCIIGTDQSQLTTPGNHGHTIPHSHPRPNSVLNPSASAYQPLVGQLLASAPVSHPVVPHPHGGQHEHDPGDVPALQIHADVHQLEHQPQHTWDLSSQRESQPVSETPPPSTSQIIEQTTSNILDVSGSTFPKEPSTNTAPVKFPNTNARQRSSNVITENPELEFLRTALNSCRSNIIQQEADIKRLNETLTIRNRRIIQLEDQIKSAADTIASRTNETPVSNSNCSKHVDAVADILYSKLALMMSSSTAGTTNNNIFVNAHKSPESRTKNKDSQTDLVSCKSCNKNIPTYENIQTHPESSHMPFTCMFCDNNFTSGTDLAVHINTKHGENQACIQKFKCEICGSEFNAQRELVLHNESNHMEVEAHDIPDISPAQLSHDVSFL